MSKKNRKFKAFLVKTPQGKVGFEFLPRAEKPGKKPPVAEKPAVEKTAVEKPAAKAAPKKKKAPAKKKG